MEQLMTQWETHTTTHEISCQKKENLNLIKPLAPTTSSQATWGLEGIVKGLHEVQSAKSKLRGYYRTKYSVFQQFF